MSAVEIWLSIVLLALATVVCRSAFFIIGNAVTLPPKLQKALRYAPAAALAAIVAPDLVLNGTALDVSLLNPKLLASVGAGVFFLATRSMLGTIICGMACFTVLRLVL